MPPKKKANKTADDAVPAETQAKPAEKVEPVPEPKKDEPKAESKQPTQTTAPVAQTPLARLEQSISQEQAQAKPEESGEQKPQKIAFDDVAKLS
jgi:hypothetical protein